MSVTKKTRVLYNKIHNKQIVYGKSIKRLNNTLSTSLKNYNLVKFINNSICADLGCGNSGYGGLSLLKLGARKVHFFDYDNSIKNPLIKNLNRFKKKYEINFGNIEKTNFDNNYFDFILCQGVIHHVNSDKKAIREIYRILKKDGCFYFDVQGSGGLIAEFINKIVKSKYINDKSYKKIINKILFKQENFLPFISKHLNAKEKKIFLKITKYFDDDFFLTLQDRILSPIYKSYSEKKLKRELNKIGFKSVKRIKREPRFTNIRKILSPMYSNYNHEISKLLLGEGNIALVAKK